jgi:hypothetical protein
MPRLNPGPIVPIGTALSDFYVLTCAEIVGLLAKRLDSMK